MRALNANVCTGIVILLLSLFLIIESLQYAYTGAIGPGPGFFPIWLSGMLLVLSIVYIFSSMKNKNKDEPEKVLPDAQALKKILQIIGSLILYVLFLPLVGFILTSTLFLFFFFWRQLKWYTSIAVSIFVSCLLYWIFNFLLNVPLSKLGLFW
jgi:putative tricarboxylic transport membrane protein